MRHATQVVLFLAVLLPQSISAASRVLLLPFEPIAGDSDDAAAIARAMHRSLVVDLSRIRDMQVVEGKEVAPDRDAAVAKGKEASANFVVWGTTQYVEGRVRVVGDVLDVQSGDAAGRFKVTGTLRELFELQDLVAEHVRRHVENPKATTTPSDDESEPAPEVPAEKPLRVGPQREREPDWANPHPVMRDDITARYNYRYPVDPYFAYYGGLYGAYPHYGYYRPYYHYLSRPFWGYRLRDRYYGNYYGVPDRSLYTRYGPVSGFHGAVPLRWLND